MAFQAVVEMAAATVTAAAPADLTGAALIYMVVGTLSIIACSALVLVSCLVPAARKDHTSKMVVIIAASDLLYTFKYWIGAAAYLAGHRDVDTSFKLISDHCASAASYGYITATCSQLWNACFAIEIFCLLRNPLRSTRGQFLYYNLVVWPLLAVLSLYLLVSEAHLTANPALCLYSSPAASRATIAVAEFPLYGSTGLAALSLLYATVRLCCSRGTAATRRARLLLFSRHLVFMVAFMLLWAWVIVSEFVSTSQYDAAFAGSQGFVLGSLRLADLWWFGALSEVRLCGWPRPGCGGSKRGSAATDGGAQDCSAETELTAPLLLASAASTPGAANAGTGQVTQPIVSVASSVGFIVASAAPLPPPQPSTTALSLQSFLEPGGACSSSAAEAASGDGTSPGHPLPLPSPGPPAVSPAAEADGVVVATPASAREAWDITRALRDEFALCVLSGLCQSVLHSTALRMLGRHAGGAGQQGSTEEAGAGDSGGGGGSRQPRSVRQWNGHAATRRWRVPILEGLDAAAYFADPALHLRRAGAHRDAALVASSAGVHAALALRSSSEVAAAAIDRDLSLRAGPSAGRPSAPTFGRHSSSSASLVDTFTVTSYCDAAFADLRAAAGLTAERIVAVLEPSLLASGVLKAHFSEGASSSFFCHSADSGLLVKTVAREEVEQLLAALPSYTQHLRGNPASLLCRFYGCFSISFASMQRVWCLLMGNAMPVLDPGPRTVVFDLKGSTLNRGGGMEQAQARLRSGRSEGAVSVEALPAAAAGTPPPPAPAKPVVAQDIAFFRCFPAGLVLQPLGAADVTSDASAFAAPGMPVPSAAGEARESRAAAITAALRRDVRWLESCGLMDYSLLLLVAPVEEAAAQPAPGDAPSASRQRTVQATTAGAPAGAAISSLAPGPHGDGASFGLQLSMHKQPSLTAEGASGLARAASSAAEVWAAAGAGSATAGAAGVKGKGGSPSAVFRVPPWSPLAVNVCAPRPAAPAGARAAGAARSAASTPSGSPQGQRVHHARLTSLHRGRSLVSPNPLAINGGASSATGLRLEGEAAALLDRCTEHSVGASSDGVVCPVEVPVASEAGAGEGGLVAGAGGLFVQVGLIDLLQAWTIKKRIERGAKQALQVLRTGSCAAGAAADMSALEPHAYADRFLRMVGRVFGAEAPPDVHP